MEDLYWTHHLKSHEFIKKKWKVSKYVFSDCKKTASFWRSSADTDMNSQRLGQIRRICTSYQQKKIPRTTKSYLQLIPPGKGKISFLQWSFTGIYQPHPRKLNSTHKVDSLLMLLLHVLWFMGIFTYKFIKK